MDSIRAMKSLLVASIGVLGVVVGYDNLIDYGSNWAFVQHVLSMDTVFPDNATRATRNHEFVAATPGVLGLSSQPSGRSGCSASRVRGGVSRAP
jgi:predicted small integral membrane protein